VVPGGGADIPLQFPNTDVKDVLDFYSKLTGRKLIYSNQLVGSIYLSIGPVNHRDLPRRQIHLDVLNSRKAVEFGADGLDAVIARHALDVVHVLNHVLAPFPKRSR
jgi:hypothetical protein